MTNLKRCFAFIELALHMLFDVRFGKNSLDMWSLKKVITASSFPTIHMEAIAIVVTLLDYELEFKLTSGAQLVVIKLGLP